MGDTQLHLRWHSHTITFTDMLQELHHGRAFTDVSLVCDGGLVRAHRAVLSLCSPYLASILSSCGNDEVPLLLPEIPVQDVKFLISFIYKGQVDVPQQDIASFLNTGKHLQVLGLEQGDRLVDSPCKSEGSANSSAGSEGEEDPSSPKDLLSSNNNNTEKKLKLPLSQDVSEDTELLKMTCVKSEIDVKDEMDIKTEIEGDAEVPEDGKIDLNFYLQQAIQSASMPCPLCKKEFKSQSGLRDHIRLHTGERPFICDFCHMNFARASHLKRHRRMHTGEKPFECSVCGKDFSRGDKLKDHLRRHEAEDKLLQIRKQILHLDEPEPLETPITSSLNSSAAPAANVSTFTNAAPITSLANRVVSIHNQQQLINSKHNVPSDFEPPSKRHCSNVASLPNMGNVPSLLMPAIQSENIVPPHMLGVASIGECILRPIN